MTARISVEELRPVSARQRAAAARVRRLRHGARVLDEGLRLEPRDAGGILDLAIEGLLARLGPSLALALAVWLPFRQLVELLGFSALDGLLATLVLQILSVVPQGITASVVASLVGAALEDRRAPLAAGVRRGLLRAPGAIALLVVTQILALPLMFLCFVPFFLAQWLSWCAVPVFVLEGDELLDSDERARARAHPLAWLASFPRRVARALARSVALARSRSSLGRWILLALVGQLVLGGVLELAATGVTHPEAREFLRARLALGGGAAEFALGAVAALFTALDSCLRAALMVAFYLDLRVRREGRDLELSLLQAEGAARAAGAG